MSPIKTLLAGAFLALVSTNATAQNYDMCGTLTNNGGSGCTTLLDGNGDEWLVAGPIAPFMIGDTVRVVATTDTGCFHFCFGIVGCLNSPVVTACATATTDYCVVLTSEITSNSFAAAPLAAPVGTTATMTFNVSAPGTDQPGTGGAWVNYAMDISTFDLDINGSTGLAFGGPVNFGIVNGFPTADGLQGPNGAFTSGQNLAYSMGAVSTLFSTNDITALVGTHDLASNLTSFGSMITGGGFMELFPTTLEIKLVGSGFPEHCFGDGGDQMGCTDCPCTNNAPIGSGGGCLNSAGTGSRLIASGDPSVSLPVVSGADLRFTATDGPASQLFVLNSGDALAPGDPANPCFGTGSGAGGIAFDGLRCAITNTIRNGGRGADTNGEIGVTNPGWGGADNPPGGIAQFFGYTAGTTKYFQGIHRDSTAVNCGTGLNTTQAIEITFTP